jgi:cardiolipin synthase
VDVRILLPDPIKNDHRFVAFAARSYYDELLEVGCKIFEYGPGMLHAKYLIIDDVAAIGSANMDVRSFHINYEVTAMFYDAEVTAALARVFREDLEKARLVRALDRVGLSLPVRFLEGMARLLSPLL